MSEYEKQAEEFLKKHNVKFKAVRKADKCPLWCDGKCNHGERYLVTLSQDGRRTSFDFWNSFKDVQNGETTVSAYDVLACISNDATCPDDFEEFCSEFGYDTDSRAAEKTFKAVVKLSKKLKSVFSDEALEDLQEIS